MILVAFKDLSMSKNKEIGSEFWFDNEPIKLSSERDGLYVLSGRTAIDIIIQDIMSYKQIKSVYLPAYCCDSMIFPFTNRGIEVKLYDVSFDGELHYHFDNNINCDIFYITNYFGYENTICNSVIEHFKKNGSVIVYDKTHSFFMSNDDVMCDYSFASIRKWIGIIGGAVVYGVKEAILKGYPFLVCKQQAMLEKKTYIDGDKNISKESFLQKYNEFGHHLTDDYSNYEMDDLSYAIYKNTDISDIRKIRVSNSRFLHNNLDVEFLCKMNHESCPLFVPVLFETKEKRDFVRKVLIENMIYCPIHWPKNKFILPEMKVNKIFDTELSLICDQRYDIDDMHRIVNIMKSVN